MGRSITNPKTCPYTICLVCEGEKTEPFFFLKLAKDLEAVSYELHTDPQVLLGESAGVGEDEYLIIRFGGYEYFCALEGDVSVGVDMESVEPSSYRC